MPTFRGLYLSEDLYLAEGLFPATLPMRPQYTSNRWLLSSAASGFAHPEFDREGLSCYNGFQVPPGGILEVSEK
jgi:hypothetical protein